MITVLRNAVFMGCFDPKGGSLLHLRGKSAPFEGEVYSI